MINEKLELIAKASKFDVRKTEDDRYEVLHKEASVAADIHPDGDISYYVTDTYNSGMDWHEIDLEALADLKKFCEFMVTE